MQKTHVRTTLLLAGALLAGCEGNNLFPTDPIGTGGGRLGSIGGTVTADGLGVAGAVVSTAGGTAADSTDAAGRYALEGLGQGAYRVFLQVPVGFGLAAGDSVARTVNLAAGQSATLNWQLLRATGAVGGT
ncbi:MAG: hypothetical protein AB1941_24985 [Gemmatimonadota bacterium]